MKEIGAYVSGVAFMVVVVLMLADISKSEPKPCYEYTIWQGSASFATGHGVNKLVEEDGYYVAGDSLLPKTGTYKVEKNNCEAN